MSWAESFPGFRLKVTKWGLGYLGASVVLGFAAVNTGNNALMAIFGLVLGSYAVAGAWSRQVLGSIRATFKMPPELYAGRPAVVEMALHNISRTFPAYGLVIRDPDGRRVAFKDLLATNESSRLPLEVLPQRRGWLDLGPWRLEVLLPLGFFVKSKVLGSSQQVLVYPRLLPASSQRVRRGGGRRAPDALESRGREGDVTQLRDFREGDERRALHWKQTARQQRLVVVERQRATEKPVYYVLDPRLPDPSDIDQLARFEQQVSEVATGVVRRLQEGVSVGLVVGPKIVRPVRSVRRAPTLLRPLAEVEAQPITADPPAAVDAGRRIEFSLLRKARR
jgi:uncharacterized protein (DUF58 family)